MPENTADVIVIGGGIAGCSAAYFLARNGHSVTLVEKDAIAAHASGFAFGVLLPRLFEDTSDPVDSLVKLSLDLHRQIAAELSDGTVALRRERASVLLAQNDMEASQYRSIYRSDRASVGDVRWLEAGELSHIEARISPAIHGGLYLGDTAEISPHEFTNALWQDAGRNGARLVTGEVDSIESGSGGVNVTVGGEGYSAARVVVAAGPWSGRLLGRAGITVPVEPLKGQIVRLKAPGPELRISLWWNNDYVGSKPDGLLWCGTTEEHVGFDEDITDNARYGILASANRVLPFLKDAEVVQQTACLRPVMADGMPVLGPAPGDDRVIIATGGGRNGIVLGPALGKIAADFASEQTPDISVPLLAPSRFTA